MILFSLLTFTKNAWSCEPNLLNGVLTTSEPLEMLANDSDTLSPSTISCLNIIGSTMSNMVGFRQLTISFSVDSENRSQALKSAQKFVDILTQSGVSEPRISYSFPRAISGRSKISMAYSARTSNIQVAALAGMSGTVRIGSTEKSLVDTAIGQKIAIGNFIETGPSSFAYLILVDGSKIRIEENSLIRINKIQKDEKGQRDISLFLERGSFETDVSDTGGKYQVRTDGGIAGVRGTRFRVVAKEQENTEPEENPQEQSAIDKLKASIPDHLKNKDALKEKRKNKVNQVKESIQAKTLQITTYEGSVVLGNTGDIDSNKENDIEKEVLVEAGFFSETNVGGQSQPSNPQAIPNAPIIYGPRIGNIKENSLFSWSEALQEDQTRYVIEISRDAGFSIDVQQYYSTLPNLVIRGGIAPGDWYWHVAAINDVEVRSDWSSTYGFFVPYRTK
jgi:hypothetical protein